MFFSKIIGTIERRKYLRCKLFYTSCIGRFHSSIVLIIVKCLSEVTDNGVFDSNTLWSLITPREIRILIVICGVGGRAEECQKLNILLLNSIRLFTNFSSAVLIILENIEIVQKQATIRLIITNILIYPLSNDKKNRKNSVAMETTTVLLCLP